MVLKKYSKGKSKLIELANPKLFVYLLTQIILKWGVIKKVLQRKNQQTILSKNLQVYFFYFPFYQNGSVSIDNKIIGGCIRI